MKNFKKSMTLPTLKKNIMKLYWKLRKIGFKKIMISAL